MILPRLWSKILRRQIDAMGTEIWQKGRMRKLSRTFAGVNRRACEQSGRGVVVLVDE